MEHGKIPAKSFYSSAHKYHLFVVIVFWSLLLIAKSCCLTLPQYSAPLSIKIRNIGN